MIHISVDKTWIHQQSRNETSVQNTGERRQKLFNQQESWRLLFLGLTGCCAHRLSKKIQNYQWKILYSIAGVTKQCYSGLTSAFGKEKISFYHDNAPTPTSSSSVIKLWIAFQTAVTLFTRFSHQWLFLLSSLKKQLTWKRFILNTEVITETNSNLTSRIKLNKEAVWTLGTFSVYYFCSSKRYFMIKINIILVKA